jgi:hypothetical protein
MFKSRENGLGWRGRWLAPPASWYRLRFAALLLLVLLQLAGAQRSWGQLPPPGTPSQFDLVGFLQEATQSSSQAGAARGGSLKVNGHSVVVPDNTIVILPANALTWQELFSQAPSPYAPNATGLALADSPAPLTTYEVHVIGNRVGDTYIAGLIYLSQQELNSGTGFINFIDYARGELWVGGRLTLGANGVPVNVLDPANPGTRIRINDPTGKFGPATTPDQRFTLDPENPTVRSETGFPMCLPRTSPTSPAPDSLCPEGNRPKDVTGNFLATINMPDPATLAAGQLPDPRIMAPFELGDYITYAGTLVSDSGTSGPYPGSSATFISAHTITSNVAIYTSPGTNPAYVAVDVTIIGTGGLTVLGAGEAALRTRFEGMTTDPSRNIHLFGIDFDGNGNPSDRDLGAVGVDPGAPTGAVRGRWRFRPPCTGFVPTTKVCTLGPSGTFLPPPREVRAVIEGAWRPGMTAAATGGANGLIAGQYHAPILEYIFPENVPGTPPPPNNFETIPFLAQGGYTSAGGTMAAQLSPWPGRTAPNTCIAPVANAGTPFRVASGATAVPLAGSATGTAPLTFLWTTTALQNGQPLAINNRTSLTPTFNAPTFTGASRTIVFTLTVTGCNGTTSSATVEVQVEPTPATPILNPITAQTVVSGTPVTVTARGTVPASYRFVWTQTGGPAQAFTQNGAAIQFTRVIPTGRITNDVLTFSVVAADAAPSTLTSNTVSTTVTVRPVPDVDTINTAQYRTSKRRLDLTATSSVVNPNLTLTLQPYRTTTGAIFDPGTLGAELTNNGNGTYTMALIGAPQPQGQVLVIRSSIGGVSPAVTPTVRN